MAKDYYVVLGIAQNATEKQIRTRFLELARERHPDRYRGPDKAKVEEEFQEITEAFNVLSDRNRRRQLDSELARPTHAQQGSSEEAARVYISRGVEALRAGDAARAIENLERATQEHPESGKAWYHLGQACLQRPGGRGRARVAFAKACEVEPMNAIYLKEAGKAHDDGGMHAEAAKFYKGALDWGGEDPELREAFKNSLRLAKTAG